MKNLTHTQGKLLCQLIHSLRPEWHIPGIENAVRKAATDATGADVAVAAVRAAVDPQSKTPGIIPQPGPHWTQTEKGKRTPPTPCHEHPGQPAGLCTQCALIQPTPPERIRQIRTATKEKTE